MKIEKRNMMPIMFLIFHLTTSVIISTKIAGIDLSKFLLSFAIDLCRVR